jgi:hypothetical protein
MSYIYLFYSNLELSFLNFRLYEGNYLHAIPAYEGLHHVAG